jgi:Ca2+-transporting ATPase
MTYVFANAADDRIIAAKGAAKAIIRQSSLPKDSVATIENVVQTLAKDGCRVLGVGLVTYDEDHYPES